MSAEPVSASGVRVRKYGLGSGAVYDSISRALKIWMKQQNV